MEREFATVDGSYCERVPGFFAKIGVSDSGGEHTNTAFGLSLALDYARASRNTVLENLIVQRSKDYYLQDAGCPITWEPSGFDFISPCLQEAELMGKVLPKPEFEKWLVAFLPELVDPNFKLAPGIVADRTDGKLVHLDGLNFSRAWCFYQLAEALPAHKKTWWRLQIPTCALR